MPDNKKSNICTERVLLEYDRNVPKYFFSAYLDATRRILRLCDGASEATEIIKELLIKKLLDPKKEIKIIQTNKIEFLPAILEHFYPKIINLITPLPSHIDGLSQNEEQISGLPVQGTSLESYMNFTEIEGISLEEYQSFVAKRRKEEIEEEIEEELSDDVMKLNALLELEGIPFTALTSLHMLRISRAQFLSKKLSEYVTDHIEEFCFDTKHFIDKEELKYCNLDIPKYTCLDDKLEYIKEFFNFYAFSKRELGMDGEFSKKYAVSPVYEEKFPYIYSYFKKCEEEYLKHKKDNNKKDNIDNKNINSLLYTSANAIFNIIIEKIGIEATSNPLDHILDFVPKIFGITTNIEEYLLEHIPSDQLYKFKDTSWQFKGQLRFSFIFKYCFPVTYTALIDHKVYKEKLSKLNERKSIKCYDLLSTKKEDNHELVYIFICIILEQVVDLYHKKTSEIMKFQEIESKIAHDLIESMRPMFSNWSIHSVFPNNPIIESITEKVSLNCESDCYYKDLNDCIISYDSNESLYKLYDGHQKFCENINKLASHFKYYLNAKELLRISTGLEFCEENKIESYITAREKNNQKPEDEYFEDIRMSEKNIKILSDAIGMPLFFIFLQHNLNLAASTNTINNLLLYIKLNLRHHPNHQDLKSIVIGENKHKDNESINYTSLEFTSQPENTTDNSTHSSQTKKINFITSRIVNKEQKTQDSENQTKELRNHMGSNTDLVIIFQTPTTAIETKPEEWYEELLHNAFDRDDKDKIQVVVARFADEQFKEDSLLMDSVGVFSDKSKAFVETSEKSLRKGGYLRIIAGTAQHLTNSEERVLYNQKLKLEFDNLVEKKCKEKEASIAEYNKEKDAERSEKRAARREREEQLQKIRKLIQQEGISSPTLDLLILSAQEDPKEEVLKLVEKEMESQKAKGHLDFSSFIEESSYQKLNRIMRVGATQAPSRSLAEQLKKEVDFQIARNIDIDSLSYIEKSSLQTLYDFIQVAESTPTASEFKIISRLVETQRAKGNLDSSPRVHESTICLFVLFLLNSVFISLIKDKQEESKSLEQKEEQTQRVEQQSELLSHTVSDNASIVDLKRLSTLEREEEQTQRVEQPGPSSTVSEAQITETNQTNQSRY